MLTVTEIMDATRKTHKQVWRNKGNVQCYWDSVKAWTASDKTKMRTVKGRARDRSTTNATHRFEIDFYGKGKDAQVWVTCNCEYFFFNCAWALNKKGSSDLGTGLDGYEEAGWAPKITNPRNSPRACKHIIAAFVQGAPSLTAGRYHGKRGKRR